MPEATLLQARDLIVQSFDFSNYIFMTDNHIKIFNLKRWVILIVALTLLIANTISVFARSGWGGGRSCVVAHAARMAAGIFFFLMA